MRGLLSTRDIRTANTPLGLLGIAPSPVNRASVAAPAPAAPPQRERVSGWRLLDRVLGGQTITEGLDAERERLTAEALRPQQEAEMARLRALAAQQGGPLAELALAFNPQEAGKAFASNLEGYTLGAGGMRGGIGGVVASAPTFTTVNDTVFRNDAATGTSTPTATAAPAYSDVTGRINAENPVLAPGAVWVGPDGQPRGHGAPRLETLSDGAELYTEAGQPVARNAPDSGNRKSYEDSIGVRRYEDTGEPVFPDDFARVRGQAESRLTAADQAADNLEAEINKALNLSGGGETGVVGAVMGAVPGTRARQLRNVIETIKSNIGFNYLQQMRELSPTGGALGNVALQELQYLQSVFGNLDPNMSEDQLDGVLRQILGIVGQGRALRQQAFQSQYGAAPSVRGGQAQQQGQPGQAQVSREAALAELRRRGLIR